MSRRGFRRSPLTRQDQPSPETPAVRDNDVMLDRPGNGRRMGCFGWLLSAGVLLGMLVAGVWLAWWVWLHVVINIPIQNQEAGITLPPSSRRQPGSATCSMSPWTAKSTPPCRSSRP